MTAPDIDQDDTTDDDLAPEDFARIREALAAASQAQPTYHLLPADHELEWTGRDGDRHFLSIGEHEVVVDLAAGRLEPTNPHAVRGLAVQRLGEVHGEGAVFPAGERTVGLDYGSLQIVSEADGVVTATAMTLADESGAAVRADLTIDLEWGVTVAPLEGPTIDGAYLGSYYGDSEFPFDGRTFVITWDTWEVDQTTDDGMVGGRCTAVSDGAEYELYAYFSGETGIQIVQADPAGGDEDGGSGITKEYLAEYYGGDRIEFEGAGIVVDWDTWEPDQVTDEGLVGSPAKGVDDDGVENELYLWFDPAEGIQIVSAEKVGGAAEQADPAQHFAEAVLPALREHWTRTDKQLRDTAGKEYDVSGWLDGDSECEPELEGVDGDTFYFFLRATNADGQRVRLLLKARDVEQVTVEDEQSA